MIEAHQSVTTALEFNNRGDLLATASGKVRFHLRRLGVRANPTGLPSLPFLVLDAIHSLLQGTVFRIFATPSGQKLFELRRGFATYATVSSMCFSVRMARGVEAQGGRTFAFSPLPSPHTPHPHLHPTDQLDSRFFSVSSDKATVHVFKLEKTPEAADSSWTG